MQLSYIILDIIFFMYFGVFLYLVRITIKIQYLSRWHPSKSQEISHSYPSQLAVFIDKVRGFQDLFFWDLFFSQELFIHWGFINCVKILLHPHSHPRPHPLHSHSRPHLHCSHRPHTRNCVGSISKCIRIFQ